jgi:hypothetical protein
MVLLAAQQQARKWIKISWHSTGFGCSDHMAATYGTQAYYVFACDDRTGVCDLRPAEIRNLHTNHSRLYKKISYLSQKGCIGLAH